MATNKVIAAIFCIVLFWAATERPVPAQDQTAPSFFSTSPQWLATDEITFGGAIGDVVSKSPAGAPSGLNLLMTSTKSDLYVNLGSIGGVQ